MSKAYDQFTATMTGVFLALSGVVGYIAGWAWQDWGGLIGFLILLLVQIVRAVYWKGASRDG